MSKAVHSCVRLITPKNTFKKLNRKFTLNFLRMNQKVAFQDLGRIRYKQAWDYQETLFDSLIRSKVNKSGDGEQYLLFCEHEPVYTLGKHGDKHNLLITEQICKNKNIDFYSIDRGGDITFHGPGQLVAYPIIDLESFGIGIKKYIDLLEDVVIDVLDSYRISGEKDEKAMGVWIDASHPSKARKICAIGVRSSRFVTMHGLALNVNTDLTYFSYINPCGFIDRGVTSVQKELGEEVDFKEVKRKMKQSFAKIFGMNFK